MRIAFRLGEADLDLELSIAGADCTVADVATALADGPLRPDGMSVGEHAHRPACEGGRFPQRRKGTSSGPVPFDSRSEAPGLCSGPLNTAGGPNRFLSIPFRTEPIALLS